MAKCNQLTFLPYEGLRRIPVEHGRHATEQTVIEPIRLLTHSLPTSLLNYYLENALAIYADIINITV